MVRRCWRWGRWRHPPFVVDCLGGAGITRRFSTRGRRGCEQAASCPPVTHRICTTTPTLSLVVVPTFVHRLGRTCYRFGRPRREGVMVVGEPTGGPTVGSASVVPALELGDDVGGSGFCRRISSRRSGRWRRRLRRSARNARRRCGPRTLPVRRRRTAGPPRGDDQRGGHLSASVNSSAQVLPAIRARRVATSGVTVRAPVSHKRAAS